MGACSDGLRVQGMVTDAVTGAPLQGVSVSLLSGDELPAQTTSATGFFSFTEVEQTEGVILTFALEGYDFASVELEPLAVSVDGSSRGEDRQAINASVQLYPKKPRSNVDNALAFTVGGWVYAGDKVAPGATVALLKLEGDDTSHYVASTKTGANGRFDLPNIGHGDYRLRVWPYDGNGDGVAEYRLYSRDLFDLGVDGRYDLTNQVVVLEQPSTELLAGSFTALSTRDSSRPRGYPVRAWEIADGVEGLLRSGSAELWMHWGGEIDTELAGFELRKIDASGRASPPIGPLAITWEHDMIVHIKPPAPLVADSNSDSQYELRILSLRYRTGEAPFSPEEQDWGSIRFAVHARNELLPNPTPALYVDNRRANGLTANKALVDANTLWLVDDKGDYVGGYSASSHFTDATGFQLSWQQVPGAVSYRVYARNTVSNGNIGDDRSEWLQVSYTLSEPSNPGLDAHTVLATGVLRGYFNSFGARVDGIAYPWLFKNGVSLAVTSVDVDGFESAIDGSKVLTLSDQVGPSVELGETDWRSGSGALAPQQTRGAAFRSVLRLRTSEPVVPTAPPTFTPVGGAIVGLQAGLPAWDAETQATPVNTTREFAIPLEVRVRGACTELTHERRISDVPGDMILPVRDRAVIGAATEAAIFATNGTWLAQVTGLETFGTVDLRFRGWAIPGSATTITTVSGGSLVCALSGRDTAEFVRTESGSEITVSDATMFALNATLIFLEPSTCTGPGTCTWPTVSQRRIVRMDTRTNRLTLDSPLPGSHTTATRVFAWSNSYASLRQAFALDLVSDVAGGVDAAIWVYNGNGLRIGDVLRIDVDGKEETTADMRTATIKDIVVSDQGTRLIVDLPDNVVLVHRRSTVIAAGDGFTVNGLVDSSGNPINKRRNGFSPSGGGLFVWGTNR